MVDLPEDAPLDVVDDLIAEAEEHRIEHIVLIEYQTRQRQNTRDAERILAKIEAILAGLRCRRSYLQAMQAKP